ncbi:MAG: hypothetical protein AB1649_21175 [Chloroflexota bacterium]
MITCPWCHTTYIQFKAICNRCGGPIPTPITVPLNAPPVMPPPPPAPRPFSKSYVRRLVFSDGWAIAGFVLLLLGIIFTALGGAMMAGIVTEFLGVPFLAAGLPLFLVGWLIYAIRRRKAQTTVRVLRDGEAASGQIDSVERNYSVRVNGRNPWVIKYRFDVMGKEYKGKVSTLNDPAAIFKPGRPAHVLYLAEKPKVSTLYPHP